ncbi:serine/threonine-protein kinase pakA-like [Scylla paramamosain]|uniref:serine/threonine-protein kinase pakA-like n=1 Tax=Scylla paramamosain TaxID=85552 RepID=UPI003083455E
MTERVVVLVDMDCFYVQVEEREQPHLRGKPAAVVQYNSWRGGGIIAVNYEARGFGVKRGMRGDQARERCPDIQLVQVPVSRGKADLNKYREAGKEVINVLVEFSDCVERASIDEAYVDLTSVVDRRMAEVEERVSAAALPSTWVVGYSGEEEVEGEKGDREASLNKWVAGLNQEDKPELEEEEEEDEEMRRGRSGSKADLRLALAAAHCEEMRRAVFTRTSFKCSAGIAHNKMLAKLSCGLHKPNQQTVLPQGKVQTLWDGLPLGKVRNLGGKLGDSLTETLGCVTMGDLSRVSLSRLAVHYDHKTAHWLHSLGRGIDTEAVTSRQLAKSIGCGKNFQGRETLDTPDKVRKWTRSLADELSERLEADKASNKRTARTLTVGVRLDGDDRWCSFTRSCRLPSYDAERICRVSLALFHHTNIAATPDVWSPSIKHISLSAGKFQDLAGSGSANIQEMFRKAERKASATTPIPATAPNAPAKLSNVSARSPSILSLFSNIPATSKIPATPSNFPATLPNIPATSPSSSSTFLSPQTPSTSFFLPKLSSNASFSSPKSSSSRFFPSKTSSNSTSPPSPSSSSSSSSSSSPSSPNNNTQEEGEEDSLLDDSNTQAVMPSQSQALEETPSQSAASIHPQAEELTKRMAAKVKQGRVSFPSQGSCKERSTEVKKHPTNSFFKNFLLNKLKKDNGGDGGGTNSCDSGLESHRSDEKPESDRIVMGNTGVMETASDNEKEEERENVNYSDDEEKERTSKNSEGEEVMNNLDSESERRKDRSGKSEFEGEGKNKSNDSEDSEGREDVSDLDILVSLLDSDEENGKEIGRKEEEGREREADENDTKGTFGEERREGIDEYDLKGKFDEGRRGEKDEHMKGRLHEGRSERNKREDIEKTHDKETEEEDGNNKEKRKTEKLEDIERKPDKEKQGRLDMETKEGDNEENTRRTEEEEEEEENNAVYEDKEKSLSPELFSSWEVEKCKEKIRNRSRRRRRRLTFIKSATETSDQQTESAREVVQGSAKPDINLEAHTSGNGYSGRGNSATDKTAGLQLNRRDGGVTESAISHVEADTGASHTREAQNSATSNLQANLSSITTATSNLQAKTTITTTGTTNQDPQNSARGERDSTTAETRPGTSDDSARESQVLALELFPDLDNVDTSLLPLLPENLRAEVEALLARHCKNTTQHCTGDATHSALPEPQETRGIMKYISRSPKKHAEKDGGSDLVQCKECQRFVSPFDLPEHLDFHVALKLQSDLRQSGAGSEGAGRVVTGRGKKRGRPSRQEAIGKKIQKLDAFFTR